MNQGYLSRMGIAAFCGLDELALFGLAVIRWVVHIRYTNVIKMDIRYRGHYKPVCFRIVGIVTVMCESVQVQHQLSSMS